MFAILLRTSQNSGAFMVVKGKKQIREFPYLDCKTPYSVCRNVRRPWLVRSCHRETLKFNHNHSHGLNPVKGVSPIPILAVLQPLFANFSLYFSFAKAYRCLSIYQGRPCLKLYDSTLIEKATRHSPVETKSVSQTSSFAKFRLRQTFELPRNWISVTVAENICLKTENRGKMVNPLKNLIFPKNLILNASRQVQEWKERFYTNVFQKGVFFSSLSILPGSLHLRSWPVSKLMYLSQKKKSRVWWFWTSE